MLAMVVHPACRPFGHDEPEQERQEQVSHRAAARPRRLVASSAGTPADAPGDLGELAGLSGAATTTNVDRLEERGYVRRARDTVDRRRVVVRLTPAGEAKLGELRGPLAREGARLLARFTDAELEKVRGFLSDAALLVDRQRLHLRGRAGAAPTPRRSARGGGRQRQTYATRSSK
jgi:DNA-binding MarR family transcriptional regulator